MKRKLLPLLIAGLTVGAAGTALAGAPTIYGKVNVTAHMNENEAANPANDVENYSMESNASRLGIKGDFDVTEGLKAIYKLEYEIFVDDGTDANNDSGDELSPRNIYAGLQGSLGTVIAGRNDTPLKLAQGEVDRFNDLILGDINNVMVGENRANNMIMYSTPSMSGFGFTIATIGGVDDTDNTGSDDDDSDSLTDAYSAAATFTSEAVYLALAADSNMRGTTDAIRAVAEVTFGPAKIGAIYQMAEGHDDGIAIQSISSTRDIPSYDGVGVEEQDAYVLNGEVKLGGPWKLKAQYGYSESTSLTTGLDDVEVTQMAAGIDYKLNDNAKLFAYYAMLETEGDATFTNNSVEDSTFAVGFDFKF